MNQPLFSLGIVADCQYADADNERSEDPPGSGQFAHRFYRQSLSKLTEAVRTFNRAGVAAVIHAGDLVDRRLEDAEPVLDILKTSVAPVWHLAGNHDFSGTEQPEQVYAALGMEAPYYSRIMNDFRLIFLDSNELGVIRHPEGSEPYREGARLLEELRRAGRPNAFPWNGGVGAEQLGWLAMELAEARRQGQKAVLFVHHPYFPEHPHNMLNDLEFREVVLRFPEVVASFNGHNHWGNFGVLDGVGCLTLQGMVEQETNSYAVAHFHANRIELEGFGREPHRTLHYRI